MNPNIKEALDHLDSAAKLISKYLNGKNKRGIITNILNSAYDIKKYYKEIEKDLKTK